MAFAPRRRVIRGMWPAAITVLGALAASCATPRVWSESSDPRPAEAREPIQRKTSILAYRTHDGVQHAWIGTVEPRGADSLLFVQRAEPETGVTRGRSAARVTLLRREVEWVRLDSRHDPGALVLSGSMIAGALILLGIFAFNP